MQLRFNFPAGYDQSEGNSLQTHSSINELRMVWLATFSSSSIMILHIPVVLLLHLLNVIFEMPKGINPSHSYCIW